MRTNFSDAQLADADTRESEQILRNCVHCGFCQATCPTYTLLGDELDSPRGRIYLIKDMLETGRPAGPREAKHIDRCLSCLSCMTTCPSGVHYGHLVDHARAWIEQTYKRPRSERLVRSMLAWLMPRRGAFRLAARLGGLARPFAGLLPGPLQTMARLAPAKVAGPAAVDRPQVFLAKGQRRMRVAMLSGCVQPVLSPEINAATIRLLTRHGCEVVVARGVGCCGALPHHLGKTDPALVMARANIDAWTRELDGAGLDAVVVNASGCGVVVKDYGHMLREDPAYAAKAARIAALARDPAEILTELGLMSPTAQIGLSIAYHPACSMQHGQKIRDEPKALLRAAGFEVREIRDAHLCCGSAGTYNILQPEIAGQLREQKAGHIRATGADLVASGNIGCITHLSGAAGRPVVHTVELLDWATGGPKPAALAGRSTI
ncbi:glycolate oxidase subunit GlcF [Phenylobacterium montanum]|uniref:Glycolate oxidase iron-sulfur subunit n=1 Tax=Phenylobacterium montanum TaxID=2823693 RepID=A0A975IX01_9CAUL|nr:glycolate oxidase subunit GlcF [Caulobacter sp. S6]QUD90119.1 glycolate oxidase subunit GlcF [Caulobacter sp. S6]